MRPESLRHKKRVKDSAGDKTRYVSVCPMPVWKSSSDRLDEYLPSLALAASRCGLLGVRLRLAIPSLPGIFDEGALMNKALFVGAVLLFGVLISLTAGAERAAAQGPAGSGAADAAVQDSSHSFDPMTWLKKDSNNSTDALGSRSDLERKLTPSLQAQGLLAANATATNACAPFTTLDGCLAVLHASHNLRVDFNCLRADVTGVLTNADMSGCQVADAEKAQSLNKAIHQLKPDVNAKEATKDAEQQAKDDLKGIGG